MSKNNFSPLQLACKKHFDINIDYFEDIQRDCETLSQVKYSGTYETKELAIDYRDHVVEAFKRDLDDILTPELIASATQEDHHAILRRIDKIRNPQISEATLQELYDHACRRTFRERLTQDNNSDLLAFYHSLMDVMVWECKEVLNRKIIYVSS